MTALEKSPPIPSGHAPHKLRVGWETLTTIAREMRSLIASHHREVGGDDPFNPDWDTYFAHDRAGSAKVWTARTIDTGILVGYIVWITTRGLISVDTIFADANLVYLAPEWRSGLTGYKFLKSGIEAMRRHVDVVRVETNDLYDHGRQGVLMKRLGFRRTGEVWRDVHRK